MIRDPGVTEVRDTSLTATEIRDVVRLHEPAVRHCYLLAGPALAFGRTQVATKVFHVSPFCQTRGEYAFRFLRTEFWW